MGMSGSLEKLRTLTSRLEERIAERKAASVSSGEAASVSSDEIFPAITISSVSEDQSEAAEADGEKVRKENISRVHELYSDLKIFEKCPDFGTIFLYKAMNLSGIGLKEEDFAVVREGKYIQIIAITYEPDATGKKKAKNVSLGYFGRGESLDPVLKNKIIEFVLRWRYEKAFQNLAHYRDLLKKVEKQKTLF